MHHYLKGRQFFCFSGPAAVLFQAIYVSDLDNRDIRVSAVRACLQVAGGGGGAMTRIWNDRDPCSNPTTAAETPRIVAGLLN